MKMPFGFNGKSGKKERRRGYSQEWEADDMEFSEEEYIVDVEGEYSGEYSGEYTEEYGEIEYSDEYVEAEGEYAEEYGEAEYSDEYAEAEGEYAEEYGEVEYSDEYAEAEGEYAEEYGEVEYSDEYAEAEGEYEDSEYFEEYVEEVDEYPTAEMTGIFSTEELAGLFPTEEIEEIPYEEEPYAGEIYESEDEYEEIVYDTYEEEERNPGFFAMFQDSAFGDKLVMAGGIVVLLLVLVVGFLFIGSRMTREEEDGILNVGGQIAHIETIGSAGLLVVSDAQKAALEAAEIVEDEQEEESSEGYEEEEYEIEVDVKLSMSSIEKDLKIKFINKETGKLVGNVPFSVMVESPDGKETLWSDDDMDGIIYKKNLAAGSYKVTVNPFENEKYNKFGIPGGAHKVQVKEKIDYNKVDVSDEVKSESQVDVQKEDTKKNETVVEGYLTDTVPWVESTATLVSFTEVAKSNIPNPYQEEKSTGPIKVTAEAEVTTSESPAPSADAGAEAVVLTVDATDVQTPAPSLTDVSGGDAQPSPTPTPEESPTPTPEESPTPEPTPAPSPMVVTLDKSFAAIYADIPVTIAVSVENIAGDANITVVSSDTKVATASITDKTITVAGIAPGKVNITVDCSAEVKVTEETAGGATVEKTLRYKIDPIVLAMEVIENPSKDTKSPLLDKEENEVYVQAGKDYRPATFADYYVQTKFFLKGEAKYTGWQTLNGKRYFFDASGKAVTGEQVIQGVKYNFASDGSLVTGSGTLGIDVSKWNGNIDWTAVKNSGVSYVIIRCGYRGSSQGALIKDSKFESNIQGAINAGLKVGVYFFTQALDKNEALEEASMVLDCVKKYKISYPIFLDVEPSGGRADSLDVATRTEVCKTFCETIQKYGYTAGIYANKNWLTEKLNTSELSSSYKIWLAQYASAPTYTGRYDMWQYKSTGKINGISGDVDMNLSYLGY